MSLRDLLTELKEVLPWGFGALFGLTGFIENSKIKLNPWSSVVKWLGRCINADVLNKLDAVETELVATKKKLDEHVTMDDERNMDLHRAAILRFNTAGSSTRKRTLTRSCTISPATNAIATRTRNIRITEPCTQSRTSTGFSTS